MKINNQKIISALVLFAGAALLTLSAAGLVGMFYVAVTYRLPLLLGVALGAYNLCMGAVLWRRA